MAFFDSFIGLFSPPGMKPGGVPPLALLAARKYVSAGKGRKKPKKKKKGKGPALSAELEWLLEGVRATFTEDKEQGTVHHMRRTPKMRDSAFRLSAGGQGTGWNDHIHARDFSSLMLNIDPGNRRCVVDISNTKEHKKATSAIAKEVASKLKGSGWQFASGSQGGTDFYHDMTSHGAPPGAKLDSLIDSFREALKVRCMFAHALAHENDCVGVCTEDRAVQGLGRKVRRECCLLLLILPGRAGPSSPDVS